MRIARVLTRLNLGGPARQALASDPLLVERGHELRIFTGQSEPGEGDLFDTFTRAGLDVRRVPGLRRGLSLTGDLRASRFLRKELTAFAPDVLHTHASKAGTLGRIAARRMPRSAELARVHTFHGHVLEGYYGDLMSRGLIAHERRMARATDRVIAVSHGTADDLVRLGVVEEEKLVVIPPGIDLEPLLALEPPGNPRADSPGPLRQRLGAGAADVLVGVIGRLAEVKRPDWGLDLLELLGVRYPALHLVFVGDGDARRRLEGRIAKLPPDLARRAHMLGAVEDMPEVLGEIDVVLLTSRNEGMPVALIEAAAAARPVVATNVGGVSEIVAHERTGFLGETLDELAYGLAGILDDPRAGREMGLRGRMRVERRHSAEGLARRLEELYQVVVEERRCAS